MPSRAERAGALLILTLGCVVIREALHYPLGDLRGIGPGLFPLLAGGGLSVCGGCLLLQGGLPSRESPPARFVRVFVCVMSSLLFFAFLVPLGFVPAALGIVALSSLAVGRPTTTVLLLAVGASAGGALVFVYGLGIRVPLFSWPFGGGLPGGLVSPWI